MAPSTHKTEEPSLDRGVADKCPWCSEKDGFYHRAWTCAHFEGCRSHMAVQQRALVPSLPACLSVHGWPVQLPEWKVLSAFFLRPEFACQQAPVRPAVSGGKVVDVFVDGTAAWPKEPKLRYAAWAVTVQEHCCTKFCWQVMSLGWYKQRFEQSLLQWWRQYDGQRDAIWAFESGQTALQSAVKGFQRLQRGLQVKINRSNSDLWLKMQELLKECEAG